MALSQVVKHRRELFRFVEVRHGNGKRLDKLATLAPHLALEERFGRGHKLEQAEVKQVGYQLRLTGNFAKGPLNKSALKWRYRHHGTRIPSTSPKVSGGGFKVQA